jgi:hypothetical protein
MEIKDYTLEHKRSIGAQSGRKSMGFTCEQCYGTRFNRSEGRMTCIKCGTVYMV